jgi:hypothetical protein
MRKLLVMAAIAMFGANSGPLAAQNPIQAAKDAYNKAKQQQQPGQPTKPGQPQQAQAAAPASDKGPFTPPAGTKIESVMVAPVEQGSLFGVSPYGVHVAMLSHSGSRMVMIYDGVAGPKFDQIFAQGSTGMLGVIFSPDGKRYAYCGKVGGEFIVMADGKQVARSSETQGQFGITQASCAIGFTPGSKHVYYTSNVQAGNRFVYDGKASPPGASADLREYAFSPDDDHYAYPWADPTPGSRNQKLVVDGNPAPYYGTGPQWSADSQHLFTKLSSSAVAGAVVDVLQDGKPVMRTNSVRLFIPPVGNMGIALVDRKNPPGMFMVIGGKVVPGSEVGPGQLNDVVFSPDGKHYAVRLGANQQTHIFADGKRGVGYQGIGNLQAQGVKSTWAGFTADGKVVYLASTAAGQFLVIGDEEIAMPPVGFETVISPVGSRVAAGGSGVMMLDGKVQKFPGGIATSLKFSPDGSHFAYSLNYQGGLTLVLDGVAQQGYGMIESEAPFVFSPDSKHIAYSCRPPNATGNDDLGVCLDGKFVRIGVSSNLTFTPDSNHLFWARRLGLGFRLFADGKPVLDGTPTNTTFQKEIWQMDPSGALLVLSRDATSYQRLRVTASPETSIATMVGGATGLAANH